MFDFAFVERVTDSVLIPSQAIHHFGPSTRFLGSPCKISSPLRGQSAKGPHLQVWWLCCLEVFSLGEASFSWWGVLKANPTDLWVGWGQPCLPSLQDSQQQMPYQTEFRCPCTGWPCSHQRRKEVSIEALCLRNSPQPKVPSANSQPGTQGTPGPNPHGAPLLPHSLHGPQQFPLAHPRNICLSQFLLLIPLLVLVYAGESSPQFQLMNPSY